MPCISALHEHHVAISCKRRSVVSHYYVDFASHRGYLRFPGGRRVGDQLILLLAEVKDAPKLLLTMMYG